MAAETSQVTGSMLPYSEKTIDKISIRTFDRSVSEEELVWHRDKEDRLVEALEDTDWMVQIENELPKKLDKIFISKGTYHRVIKGTGTLKVKITRFE